MGIVGNLVLACVLAAAPEPEIVAELGRVRVRLPTGLHANANPASDPSLQPLAVAFEERPGVRIGKVTYPRAKVGTFFGERLRVYEGEVEIRFEYAVETSAAGGIEARLSYQLCDDRKCYPPGQKSFLIPLPSTDFNFTAVARSDDTAPRPPPAYTPPADGPDFHRIFEKGGWPLVLVFAFLGGVLLNLTPCVYPVLPITLGYLGSGTHGRWAPWRYLLGMSFTFAALGLLAALGGALLGSALQSSWVLLGLAALLLYLAGSSMGWYEIPMPSSAASGAGPFMMGATAGLVAAPCVGPIVVGFLVFLSTRATPFFAFASLLAMGVGMGLPQAALAAGVVRWGLPKGGAWLDWSKKAMGLLLPGAAIWILLPLLQPTRAMALGAIWALSSGAYLGWLEPTRGGSGFRWLRRGVGLAYVAVALTLLFGIRPPGAATEWEAFDESKLGGGRSAVVDVRADWCAPCLELERWTFADSEVAKGLADFRRLRLDVTTAPPPHLRDWLDAREVVGVPTVMFFDSEGRERTDLRLTGFEEAGPFRERLAAAR